VRGIKKGLLLLFKENKMIRSMGIILLSPGAKL